MFYVNNPEQTEIILQNINTFAAEKLNDPDLIKNSIADLKAQAGDFVTSIINGAAKCLYTGDRYVFHPILYH